MTLTVLEMVGHLSFGLTALSFIMRDILVLRVLAIASCCFGIVYNYFLPAGPLWLVIFWISVFAVIYIVNVVLLCIQNRGITFSDEERE
ncbi:uncharacterized protein METZ01_LOCUS396067, partial [marine metagenome]